MRQIIFPNWLVWIDKNLHGLSIPKLPLILTIIQALGLVLSIVNPVVNDQLFIDKLVLIPHNVFQGEIWRIFSFITLPLLSQDSMLGYIFMFFILWLFYDIMILLENTWGSIFLTVYFLIAWFITVFVALLTDSKVDTFAFMECSFFFALATLNPNKELHLFFILPMAFKWIAFFIACILLAISLLLGYYNNIISLLASYLLFFGKDYWLRIKKELDKRKKT